MPASLGVMLFVPLVLMLGGAVKGMVGLGLPLVAISLLGLMIDPRLGLALLVIPIVVTNLWQAFATGIPRRGIARFWPLIALFAVGTWFGALILVRIDAAMLLGLLGVVVVVFCSLNLLNPSLRLPPRLEGVAGPVVGMGTGLLNGVSTVNGPPLAMYLIALGLEKDEFVAAYALIALGGSIPLALSFMSVGLMGGQELWWSTLAVAPVLLGQYLGQRLRQYIDPALFKRILLCTLILLGLNLIRRSLF